MSKYQISPQQQDLLKHWHYHPPFGDQANRYAAMNAATSHCAQIMFENAPPSRELSLAITKLQEARMWANAAIACNEKPESEG